MNKECTVSILTFAAKISVCQPSRFDDSRRMKRKVPRIVHLIHRLLSPIAQSDGIGTGTSILPSTLSATTSLLTKLYPPTVATASTICLSSRNLWRPSKIGCGTCTDLVMKSAKSIATLSSGVSDDFGVCSDAKACARRISRSCATLRPALRPTGSCCNLSWREDRRSSRARSPHPSTHQTYAALFKVPVRRIYSNVRTFRAQRSRRLSESKRTHEELSHDCWERVVVTNDPEEIVPSSCERIVLESARRSESGPG